MSNLVKIIDSMAEKRCVDVLDKDSFVSGHNGPYYDEETPVRVAAHWIIVFSYEYKKTGNVNYQKAIQKSADYICGMRLNNGTFPCRKEEGKDSVNGIIGAAWAIEGLIEAAKVLNDEKYYSAAVSAFFAHPFNEGLGLWERRDITGETIGFDATYNHQLWLAAAGAQICDYKKDERIEKQVLQFLEHSKKTFRTFRNGLVFHFVFFNKPLIRRAKSIKSYYRQWILRTLSKPSYQYKEEGYHNFSLYAFAILHKYYPDHSFFRTKKFKKALLYSLDMTNSFALEYVNHNTDGTGLAKDSKVKGNIYGFSYNSPAFEIPLIVKEFSENDYTEEVDKLIEKQIMLTYDQRSNSFCRNTDDAVTLDARVYEYIRALMM